MITFRPSYRSQLYRALQLLVMLGLLLWLGFVFLQEQLPLSGFLICGFWLVVAGGSATLGLYRLRSREIHMDEQQFRAQIDGEIVNIAWQELLFARLVGNFLELATCSSRYVILLQHLNTKHIWEYIRKFAPASAFSQHAYLQVPAYQKAIAEFQTLLQDQHISFRVGYPRSTKIGRCLLFIVMLLGFTLSSAVSLSDEDLWIFIVLFATFILFVGAWAFRSIQTLEVTAQKVIVSNGLRRSELHWHEIEKLRADPLYERFVFYGKGQHLVAPGLRVWGADNPKLEKMFRAQVWQHQIEVEDRNRRQPIFLLSMVPTS